jgi:hypothetical protein
LIQNQPIFNAAEIKENDLKKQKLLTLLKSGEGILMAGAGCTATIYPDWLSFINLLQEEALQADAAFERFDGHHENFLDFADRVKEKIGANPYYNLIFRSFKEKPTRHEKFHESLCRLLHNRKLKGITTTNYDPVFESAHTAVTGKPVSTITIEPGLEQARILEFLMSLNDHSSEKGILHLHGYCDRKESIILSKTEYEAKYGFRLKQPVKTIFEAIIANEIDEYQFAELLKDYGMVWTTHRKLMWSLFATRRLIFIGFSLSDPYFNKMLEFVSNDLHTFGYEMHFLILRVTTIEDKERAMARAKRLKEKFGIETVMYEENDSDTGLENFVFEMEKSTIAGPIPEETIAEATPMIVEESDEELTRKLINESKRR